MKKLYILMSMVSVVSLTLESSQTESYLKTLGTRRQAYHKIAEALKAPINPNVREPLISINNPEAFAPIIDQVITSEKQHPNYYALYHAAQKEGILLTMLRTYILQQENGWKRDDFFILRRPEFFYKTPAATAEDYIKQNVPAITQQYLGPSFKGSQDNALKELCIRGKEDGCWQFDFHSPYREHLISASPAFISNVDDTSIEQRNMSETDYTAWESAFYYFAINLSWSSVRRLYGILISDLQGYYPALFENNEINIVVRKYIALQFAKIVSLLFPHAAQQLSQQQQVHAKAGMAIQFLIPQNIINDVAYLAWDNGILWQRTINNIKDGWSDEFGAYTKIGPLLEILRTNPQKLSRSINLLQARLILKDKKYFYEPSSPIKMHIIHSLQASAFRTIVDALKAIAQVVVENNKAQRAGQQQEWLERSNITFFVLEQEYRLKQLLKSQNVAGQIMGLNELFYFVKSGVDINFAREIATQFNQSDNEQLKQISQDILDNSK